MDAADNWTINPAMSPRAFVRAIKALGLKQAQAGRFLGVSERTARRYVTGDAEIPRAQVMVLRAAIAQGIDPVVPEWRRGGS